jgi:hypothetical protein
LHNNNILNSRALAQNTIQLELGTGSESLWLNVTMFVQKGYTHIQRAACVPDSQTSSQRLYYYALSCVWHDMRCTAKTQFISFKARERRKKNTTLRAPNRTFCFSRRLFVCCLPDWLCQSAGGVAQHIALSLCALTKSSISPGKQCRRSSGLFNFHKNSSYAGGVLPHFADWQSTNSWLLCLVRGHLSVWDEI